MLRGPKLRTIASVLPAILLSGLLSFFHIIGIPKFLSSAVIIAASITLSGWVIFEVIMRRKTQEELRKSEESYRLLISNVKDYAIFMLNPQGKVVSWNSGAEHIKGYKEEEIIGKSFEVFYKKEDVENGEPMKNLELARLYGHYEHEGWRLRKDGSQFWANVILTALYNSKKQFYGFAKITRDITEQAKARKELELLNRQINLANDAIYTLDANFKITSWNKGAENMYGFPAIEMIGKDPNTMLHTDISPEEIKVLIGIVTTKDYWSGELKRRTKHGEDIYISNSATTLRNEEGAVTAYVVVNLNITHQKKLREQLGHLALMVEHSTEAIITRGLDQKIISWNVGAEKMFGFSKNEAIGKTVKELGFAKFSDLDLVNIERQVAQSGSWKTELLYHHKNGSSFFGVVTGNGIRDNTGNISSFIFIVRDISERKKLEEDLKQLNEALETKVRERTEEISKNEKRFRTLIENNNDVISLADETMTVFYRSPSSLRITGWNDEESLGASEPAHVHPDDKRFADSVVSKALAEAGKAIPFIFRSRHKKGHYLWLEGVVVNLLPDDYVKAILFNYRDVTERVEAGEKLKSSEMHYRMLVEQLVDGIFISDDNGKYLDVNTAGCKMLGYTRQELVQMTIADVVVKEEIPRIAHEIERFSNNRVALSEWHFRRKDQSVFIGEVIGRNLPNGHLQAILRDITERKEAESALVASEEKYRTFIERITDAFIGLDNNWNYTYLNKQAGELIHRNPNELVGKNVWDIFPDAVGSSTYRAFKKAMDQQSYESNIDYYPPLELWQENHVYPSPDGLSVFIRNITEKKKAEEEIRESNQRFELVATATNDIIWDWEMATDRFWWNENYYTFFGYPKSDLALTVQSWQYGIHPDDRQKVLSGIRLSISNKDKFWKDEYRFLKSDGTTVFVLDCGYILYDEEMNPYRMVGAMLDITGRKNAEALVQKSFVEKQELANRMSTILNTLPANIALLDSHGNIIEVNDSWKKFADTNHFLGPDYGIGTNYIAIAGQTYGEEIKDGKIVALGIKKILHDNFGEFIYEYSCHSPTVKRWFRMVVTPLQGKDMTGAVVMHIDISEIKRLEQERMESKTEEQKKITRAILSAQEKERNIIGAELHDNVNQILAGTKLLLSLGQNYPEKSSEMIVASLDNIQNAIEENRKIAHELVVPNFEEINLSDQLTSLIDNMLKKAEIDVVFDNALLNEGFLEDEQKLAVYRMAQEQCTNILKYAGASRVLISLNTLGSQFSMKIRDNGKGLQAGKVISGIGLHNIKSRLSLFNGDLRIDTAPGKGFVLEVTMPLKNRQVFRQQ